MNRRYYILTAAVFGALAVAIGAFGAHSLREMMSDRMYRIFKTGAHYHLIHSVVLLALAFYHKMDVKLPFNFISVGIILFSFSLYAYALSGLTFLAFFAPFGGLTFIIGWILIAWKGWSAAKAEDENA